MRTRAIALPLLLLLVLASSAYAQDQARIIPRRQQIDRPVEKVYDTLKNYLSSPSRSLFNLTSAERVSGTIVATRHGIDPGTWTQWAYCKTAPEQMVYSLGDGSVTVTVKLQGSGSGATFMTVTSDFKGTYVPPSLLGKPNVVIDCSSKGGLEDTLFAVASGAQPQATP